MHCLVFKGIIPQLLIPSSHLAPGASAVPALQSSPVSPFPTRVAMPPCPPRPRPPLPSSPSLSLKVIRPSEVFSHLCSS